MKKLLTLFFFLSAFISNAQWPMFMGNNNYVVPPSGVQVSTVLSTTGKIWMDRNLGASQVATSLTDAASFGDLY